MLLSEDSSVLISVSKTLVRTAVQTFWNTLFASKHNHNRCDHHKKLFIIIGI